MIISAEKQMAMLATLFSVALASTYIPYRSLKPPYSIDNWNIGGGIAPCFLLRPSGSYVERWRRGTVTLSLFVDCCWELVAFWGVSEWDVH